MVNVVVNIPDYFAKIPRVELSLFVSRLLKEKTERIERLEREMQKSKLTQEKADEIADRISEDLAKRYIDQEVKHEVGCRC